MLKPVVGSPEAFATTRTFWLMFAVLDVIAAVGLILFARAFTADTPDTRRRARTVMSGVYTLILLVGIAFLYAAISAAPMQYRTLVQSVIFLALGAGGVLVSLKRR
jgi:hypothetical protein